MDQPEAYVKRMIVNELASWRRRKAASVVPLSLDALVEVFRPAREAGLRVTRTIHGRVPDAA